MEVATLLWKKKKSGLWLWFELLFMFSKNKSIQKRECQLYKPCQVRKAAEFFSIGIEMSWPVEGMERWIATWSNWSETAALEEVVQVSWSTPSPLMPMKLDELDPACWLGIRVALAYPRPSELGTELCGTWLFSEEATGTYPVEEETKA